MRKMTAQKICVKQTRDLILLFAKPNTRIAHNIAINSYLSASEFETFDAQQKPGR